jgi:hypothetical protein
MGAGMTAKKKAKADAVELISSCEAALPIKPGTHHLAFPTYIGIPHGCTLYLVPDDRMYPHVRAKATVVVDCTDREVRFGEYFLIQQSDGPAVWEFIRPKPNMRSSERPTVYLRLAGWDPFRKEMGHWGEGAIYRDALERRIIGRVIGVLDGVDPQ